MFIVRVYWIDKKESLFFPWCLSYDLNNCFFFLLWWSGWVCSRPDRDTERILARCYLNIIVKAVIVRALHISGGKSDVTSGVWEFYRLFKQPAEKQIDNINDLEKSVCSRLTIQPFWFRIIKYGMERIV